MNEGGPVSVDVITFGCRLNAAESEVIRREAERAGFADTVVVNTCAVKIGRASCRERVCHNV